MGSGDWFKNIINKKKGKNEKSKKIKESASEKSNGAKEEHQLQKESPKLLNGVSGRKQRVPIVLAEDVAATRIQTAFRAYMARKTFRLLKGITKLQAVIQGHSGKKQAQSTLSYLHSWSKIQAQIRSRRVHMVTEGRLRHKKLENQLKLEAKLHDLERFSYNIMYYRSSGMVAQKLWKKLLRGYIREKKQQSSASELWRMPFRINGGPTVTHTWKGPKRN